MAHCRYILALFRRKTYSCRGHEMALIFCSRKHHVAGLFHAVHGDVILFIYSGNSSLKGLGPICCFHSCHETKPNSRQDSYLSLLKKKNSSGHENECLKHLKACGVSSLNLIFLSGIIAINFTTVTFIPVHGAVQTDTSHSCLSK